MKEVVTQPILGKSFDALAEENAALQKKCSAEKATIELLNVSLRVTGFQMQYMRVAAGELKAKLLDAIDTAKEYTHFSINSLAMFAKRKQMVFASVSAWYRFVREFNLRKSGVRIYPPKAKIGIRALEPNQIWHVDVSVFRIVSGAKVYIQAIIDIASRYVLAWHVTQGYGGANTKALTEKALEVANRVSARVGVPHLFADDGTENQNKDVDSLVDAGRIIAPLRKLMSSSRTV